MKSELLESVVGIMVHNHRMNDPEWRFQAGFASELLEKGAEMPTGQLLKDMCRVMGKKEISRREFISWGKKQEIEVN